MKHLISISELSPDLINQLINSATRLKKKAFPIDAPLKGRCLGLVFQKPSTRTRVSFEVGMAQLGGYSIYLGSDDIELGIREETRDIARTLSRYMDGVVARTFSHTTVIELAKYSGIPIINGLSDLHHPCQALSDLLTIKEKLGHLAGVKLAYIGDGNNVLHSLMQAGSRLGISVAIASPKGYEPDEAILRGAAAEAKRRRAKITMEKTPQDAAKNSDVLYTDVWVSMGQEKERQQRVKAFRGFQINSKLLALAKPGCLVMHCLPAHRDEEITDEVMEGKSSVVFDQAENRLHMQKAILLELMGSGPVEVI